MEQFIKAIIQQYMSRMNENRLLPAITPTSYNNKY